jgi:hypothetical protein
MLPAAIKGQVIETELIINTVSAFDYRAMQDEIEDVNEENLNTSGKSRNSSLPTTSRSEQSSRYAYEISVFDSNGKIQEEIQELEEENRNSPSEGMSD